LVGQVVRLGGVTVDVSGETLRDSAGRIVPLRAQSFAVLRHLIDRAGAVVTKEELATAVWKGVAVTDDSLVQCVRDIREALGDEAQAVLRTVPRRGYRLDLPPAAAAGAPARRDSPWPRALAAAALGVLSLVVAATAWREPGREASGPPSIAVLPFDDMSAAQNLAYLGAGVAEDVIQMLARSPDVLVIARNSSFAYGGAPVDVRKVGEELGVDYVLEGSVRREGGALRVVAQLNDARTGEHVWAERFDRAGADPPALLDEVTSRIVATLVGHEGQVSRAEFRRAWGKDSASLGEYDYHLRALDVMMREWTPEGNAQVDRIVREGLAKYPDSALLKIKLAWNDWRRAYMFWSDDLTADFDRAGAGVREVLAADDLSPQVELYAHWLAAYVHMREGNWDAALAEARATASLAPHDAMVMTDLAEILVPAGRYDEALAHIEIGDTRNPAADVDYRRRLRAWVYRLQGRPEAALREYEQVVDTNAYSRLQHAIALVRLGRLDGARAQVHAARAEIPGFSQAMWREGTFYRDPSILEGEIADLAAAGLPEA
jgi:TolB-like protein/DNA-binding winged helix-turn-helix (wHTH) protein